MNIEYKYVVVAVDEAARCMEVVYEAEGRQTLHIGARLPFEGERLEDVIRAFAPTPLWEEQEKAVVAPVIGASGTISTLETAVAAPADAATLLAPSSVTPPQTGI